MEQFGKSPGGTAQGSPITAEDIATLRRDICQTGQIDEDTARGLVMLGADMATRLPEWTVLLAEALSAFITGSRMSRPLPGLVETFNLSTGQDDSLLASNSPEQRATVLLNLVSQLGHPAEAGVREALVNYAESKLDGLACVGEDVLTPDGLKHAGWTNGAILKLLEEAAIAAPVLDAAHCALLRRGVIACGVDRRIVSRAGAEMMLRIKDARLERADDPAWKQVFLQCLANHVRLSGTTSASPYADYGLAMARVNELDVSSEFGMNPLQRSLAYTRVRTELSLAEKLERGLGFLTGGKRPAAPAAAPSADSAQSWVPGVHIGGSVGGSSTTAQPVANQAGLTGEQWPAQGIGADGRTDAFEQALLDFLKEG